MTTEARQRIIDIHREALTVMERMHGRLLSMPAGTVAPQEIDEMYLRVLSARLELAEAEEGDA